MVDGSIIDAVGHCPKGTFTGSSGCGLELSNSGFLFVFTIFQRGRGADKRLCSRALRYLWQFVLIVWIQHAEDMQPMLFALMQNL